MTRLVLALAVGALAASACSSAKPREPQVHAVAIRAMQFVPAELTVAVGDVVVWTNEDVFPHTATAVGVFDSQSIATTAQWRYTATAAGQVDYVCTFHPTMKATLTVR